ncbi:MAG: S8 family serine peptidase [Calditrichaceae bacterium]
MRKGLLFTGLIVSILVTALMFSCERSTSPTDSASTEMMQAQDVPVNGTPIDGSYIVVLDQQQVSLGKTAAAVQATAKAVLYDSKMSESSIGSIYSRAITGFSVKASKEEIEKLKNDSRVSFIEQDRVITLGPSIFAKKPPAPPVAQTTPWGITRVGGATASAGKVAWIIDTGVDFEHPDLNVDIARSVTFIARTTTGDDDNGHGSHVAGTIAAIDNTEGVVGVAAGATVVAVKVLDRRGSGSTTGVIAGVDYVAANGAAGDVANMSLGGGISDALDQAVLNASNNGIYFALAAGNESDDANNHSPARVNGPYVYTVSAFDINDVFAYFSNYGNPPVDYSAPGVSILSLWKDGGTNTISGTSMATPHVAGLLLVTNGNIKTDGYVTGDPDGNADPIAHK